MLPSSIWNESSIKKASCHPLTGYHAFIFERAYIDYVWPYFNVQGLSREKAAKYFFGALQWIHMGLTSRQIPFVLGFCYSTFRTHCLPLLAHLATAMHEVDWDDRLHLMNHTPNFPRYVTFVLDTAFIPVGDPEKTDRAFAALLYQGKYGTTGLKLEVKCSLMGHIVDYKFPASVGTINDNVIHNQRVASGDLVLRDWEVGLADGAYRGCDHILTKFRRDHNRLWDPHRRSWVHIPHTPAQVKANEMISHDRQRVEHIVKLCTAHDLFKARNWQGEYDPLVNAVNVTVEMTQMQIFHSTRNGNQQNGNSRYADVIGPWPHN